MTLAQNVLRHSPLILFEIVLNKTLKYLARIYQSMVLIY
ncbi:putative transposase(fragment) [Xenorhabdus bovienii SS-2004]